ncbi:FAD-binding protein [Nguyenibacter sp. L1]|uniref:FAD-binding protein n=1 Tax=Nguyenibacter sp. L1 TaxID=3049350 RepID=UPI002B466478|nr:FAD-binding protein [Nguyenibacter sp. L1]WRH89090.1 FAD-binding protein [Nguyenibacter sp. L1]
MTRMWAFESDVLVIGGGMAAAWAAISAAREGASVTLVDKGFVGTSGVTATGGPNHWWVPPDPARRETAIRRRLETAYGLADADWMARVIDITWRTLPDLAAYYPFSGDGQGGTYYSGVRGPDYMRGLRRYALALGVRVLDHHPALELLARPDGSIGGAAGYARLQRQSWTARAGAVILATGGCAFRSGLIGSHNNTGDGYLMGVEAGAELSGMEFCVAYSISPAWASTRTLPYTGARFFDAEGRLLDVPSPLAQRDYLCALARAFAQGPVFADLHEAPELLRTVIRKIQPATPTPFERRGLDMFRDRFPVALYGEGTIRGTGGLRITDGACQTSVPGLYAAGDAATRELVAGATSGGGAQNAAWALASGVLAGSGAASLALILGKGGGRHGPLTALGQAGLRPRATSRPVDDQAAIGLARHHILDLDQALWRNAESLATAQAELNAAWAEIQDHRRGDGLGLVAAREAAAMTATARWCNAAALARTESRGMHVRTDAPAAMPAHDGRLLVDGLDRIRTRFETAGTKANAA